MLVKEERTIRGSALVTLSDTKNASLCREDSKSVWRLGYATFKFVIFVRVYCFRFYY